jgi:hypothetical protein
MFTCCNFFILGCNIINICVRHVSNIIFFFIGVFRSIPTFGTRNLPAPAKHLVGYYHSDCLVIQTKYMVNFIHQECNYLLLNFILICLLFSSEIVAKINAIFPKFIIGLFMLNFVPKECIY